MARTPRRSSSRPKIGVAIAHQDEVDSECGRQRAAAEAEFLGDRLDEEAGAEQLYGSRREYQRHGRGAGDPPSVLEHCLPPPFGDIRDRYSPSAVIRPTPIVFQSTRPESFRRETRSLHQSRKLRPNEIIVHARTQPAIGSR